MLQVQGAEDLRRQAETSHSVFQVVVPTSTYAHPDASNMPRTALLILVVLLDVLDVARLLVFRR